MPPVLTASSRNYDYDYDTVQPYFLPSGEEEDFHPPPRSQLLPGPGEDIWKKFELLPTPPLSPSRRSSLCGVPPLCDLLDDPCDPSATFLQSFIIQDCMWSSSFAAATELQKVSERLGSLRGRRDSAPAADAAGERREVGGAQVTSEYLHDPPTAATDCVDPSAVFPYGGLTEKSPETPESLLRLETPPLSSSESEEEEEEAQQEEEEEEESDVDVVTVDQRRTSRRSGSAPLVLKRSHVNIQQHNYAAQRPSRPLQPVSKRLKAGGGGGGSPRSTDGEDGGEDRRRTHNVLERQRRNELKISFTALRDQVPDLAHNHKAAKVQILIRAAEFIREVRQEEAALLRTKDELRKTSRALKLRLEQLRT